MKMLIIIVVMSLMSFYASWQAEGKTFLDYFLLTPVRFRLSKDGLVVLHDLAGDLIRDMSVGGLAAREMRSVKTL